MLVPLGGEEAFKNWWYRSDATHVSFYTEKAMCAVARRHGLSLNAAALMERLAERTFAAEFCNAPMEPSEERHRDSLLAGGENFRALYDAHLKRLREMCIYDPGGWCRDRGFERR